MIFVLCVLISVVASLADGRDLLPLSRVSFRWGWLIPLALALQLLLFSGIWARLPHADAIWSPAYLLSMVLVGLFCGLNWRVPGIPLLTLGLLLNGAAIVANGGAMPASMDALRLAGLASTPEEVAAAVGSNSVLAAPGTPLWFLGDIWAIPEGLPFANVFSAGDVVLGLGGAWFVFANSAPGDRP